MEEQSQVVVKFSLAKAYLELARSCLQTEIKAPHSLQELSDDITETENTIVALLAQTYVFSYMAISAFVNYHLGRLWDETDRPLQIKYPIVNDLEQLFRKELKDLKNCIKELCQQYNIKPLHEAKPDLWNDLQQVVKETRNFMVHPIPDPEAFDKIIGGAWSKYPWGFPSKVAEKTIAYFFEAKGMAVPEWVRNNQDFSVETIRALRVKDWSKNAGDEEIDL